MNNYIKGYIPVYERMTERWVHNPKMNSASGDKMVVKHERGNVDFWGAKPISRPAVLGRIIRLRRHRIGQLELYCKITPKKRLKKEHYQKVYC